ncbi:SDR family NAD(P)-dependent oxidoreductase [Psychrobacillus sp. OK032]|uniref:SDR family NAD(P)-dependent oxidoreductase n=1 Tax=Psychrobacillus sp. OK032 TaxID=1884358 RepID=UPI0008B772EE|nr:SDR family NAD(P)-dependent oxidoreductase [Psychrobacillus sp. OK032]SER82151.1 3-oxoacyl-[acyl-carrier protein] reductase [Psychrobacillus sp. OK032]
MQLIGQVAVVTGGGNNIGKAVSWRMAREGAYVIVADINFSAAEKVATDITEAGLKAIPYRVDVSIKHEVRDMMRTIEGDLGQIDILANIAGILGPTAPTSEISEEDWDLILDVNLKGTFLCCQAVIDGMISRGYGRIVNMSSITGKEGNPMLAAYVSSKAGVMGFTKSLGKETAKSGVTVNCIAPTMIEGDMIKTVSESYFQSVLNKIPMGRLGKPEEVAGLFNYLVSEEAGYITGQCLDMSGGRAVY